MIQSLKKDVIWLFLIKMSHIVLGFISGVIIARGLGPSERGILGLFGAIIALMTYFCDVGLTSASVYFLGKGKTQLSTVHSSIVVWDFIVLVFLLTISIYLVNQNIPIDFFSDIPVIYIVLALLIVPFNMYISQWAGMMTGLDHIRKAREFGLINQLISLGFTIFIILIMKWSLFFFVIFSVLANLCITIVAFFLLKSFSINTLDFEFSLQALKDKLTYGLNAYLGLLVFTLHLRLDIFLIGHLLNSEQVGFYVIAVGIAESIQYVDTSIVDAILYKITHFTQEKSLSLICRTNRHTTFIIILLVILLIVLSYPLVIFIYGRQYSPAILPLILLLPGLLTFSVTRQLASFIAFQLGRPRINLIAALVGLIVNFMLNLYLIPLYGINGAAFASAISYALTAILVAWAFRWLSNASINETFVLTRKDLELYFAILTKAKLFVCNALSNFKRV
jgi:O-antigen/teichoic acid export membrane protein